MEIIDFLQAVPWGFPNERVEINAENIKNIQVRHC